MVSFEVSKYSSKSRSSRNHPAWSGAPAGLSLLSCLFLVGSTSNPLDGDLLGSTFQDASRKNVRTVFHDPSWACRRMIVLNDVNSKMKI